MKIVGVVLAAGASSRFGSDKLDHPFGEGLTLGQASARGLAAVVPKCVAVVRNSDGRLGRELRALGFMLVEQPQPREGMAASLARGIGASADADGWLIALADMPAIRQETIRSVYRQLCRGASIVAPCYRGRRGHPVGFAARWRTELLALRGDAGARPVLSRHAAEIDRIEVDDPGILFDIDHVADLTQAP